MTAVIFGNVTLDVICYPVIDVPRHETITFEQAVVYPGGCASNVAIGLARLGIPTTLVTRVGDDDAADIAAQYWQRAGVDTRYIKRLPGTSTAVCVGLVDDDFQPRFIYTPGANADITIDDLPIDELSAEGYRWFHVSGYFVLPGLLPEDLARHLAKARDSGMQTSLDVVTSPAMQDPSLLWPCLPHLDYFMCNAHEGYRLTGEKEYDLIANVLQQKGAKAILVKLGSDGCFVASGTESYVVESEDVSAVDTTGAGDAFAAGFIAGMLESGDLKHAVLSGSHAGGRIVQQLGAITAWFDED